MGWYALDSSALATNWHRRGILDGVIIPKFGVLRDPDFSREGQAMHNKELGTLTPPPTIVGSNALCLNKVSTEDGCDLARQLHGFLVSHKVRLVLVLKGICTHLLAEC
jgi:hypothetical protein